jgi:hypothetical protein
LGRERSQCARLGLHTGPKCICGHKLVCHRRPKTSISSKFFQEGVEPKSKRASIDVSGVLKLLTN